MSMKQRVARRYMRRATDPDVRWGLDQLRSALAILRDVYTVWTHNPPKDTAAQEARIVAETLKTIQPVSRQLWTQVSRLKTVVKASAVPATPEMYFRAGGEVESPHAGMVVIPSRTRFKVIREPKSVSSLGGVYTGINVDAVKVIVGNKTKIYPPGKLTINQLLSRRPSQKDAAERPGYLQPQLKQKITRVFKLEGLDGNGRFTKAEHGYSKAVEVLSDYGIEIAETPNSHIFTNPEGRFTLDLAFKNPEDSFSPTPIRNSTLVVSFYQTAGGRELSRVLEQDKYEVTAYLS